MGPRLSPAPPRPSRPSVRPAATATGRPGPASRRRAVPGTWPSSAAGSRRTPAAPPPARPGPWPAGRRESVSPGTFRWMRAFGSRSATSDGSAKLPNRMDRLRLSGRSASSATHVTRRPISSQVPSMNSPSGASRPCTSRQMAATSASSYCRSTLNARTRTGRPATGSSKPPSWKLRPGPFQVPGQPDPLGLDFDADHPHVGPDRGQPFKEFDGGGRGGAVAQIHHEGIGRRAQPPGLRPGQPAVQPAHPVGVGGAAGNVAHRPAGAGPLFATPRLSMPRFSSTWLRGRHPLSLLHHRPPYPPARHSSAAAM